MVIVGVVRAKDKNAFKHRGKGGGSACVSSLSEPNSSKRTLTPKGQVYCPSPMTGRQCNLCVFVCNVTRKVCKIQHYYIVSFH